MTKTIKNEFPILEKPVHGKRLVYLDNGATTQKPQQVIDALLNFYKTTNANVHRCVHLLSEEATMQYEQVREKTAKFLHAFTNEIIFTKGTTESLNMLARMLASQINEGDEILISVMEHHSNFIPWQQIAKHKKAKLVVVDITPNGEIDVEDFTKKLSAKTKIVGLVHVSHVLGTINDVKKLAQLTREHAQDAVFVVDGAQAIAHLDVDVKDIDCDFYVFSAHKMYGPTGIGILYGKKELLKDLDPCDFGGSMITKVCVEESTWAPAPQKFEAGTPNIAGVIAFGAALDFLQRQDVISLRENEKQVLTYAYEQLSKISELTIVGPNADKRSGLIAFTLKDVHPHDIAYVLDQHGVAVRAGHHCAMPLHEKLGITATTRMGIGVYNTKEDIDIMIIGLKKALETFKK